jgi:hypothetical protein
MTGCSQKVARADPRRGGTPVRHARAEAEEELFTNVSCQLRHERALICWSWGPGGVPSVLGVDRLAQRVHRSGLVQSS